MTMRRSKLKSLLRNPSLIKLGAFLVIAAIAIKLDLITNITSKNYQAFAAYITLFLITNHDELFRIAYSFWFGKFDRFKIVLLGFRFDKWSEMKSFRKTLDHICKFTDQDHREHYFIIEKILINIECKVEKNEVLLNAFDRQQIRENYLSKYYSEVNRPRNEPLFGFVENSSTTVAVHFLTEKHLYDFSAMASAGLVEVSQVEVLDTNQESYRQTNPEVQFSMNKKSIKIEFFPDQGTAIFPVDYNQNTYRFRIYPVILGHRLTPKGIIQMRKFKEKLVGWRVELIKGLQKKSEEHGYKQFRINIT